MSYIDIDLNKINEAKGALSAYGNVRKAMIGQMDSKALTIASAWKGDDSAAFKMKWDGMSSASGVFTVTHDGLKNYSELLQAIYSIYRKAQSDSVDQASKI